MAGAPPAAFADLSARTAAVDPLSARFGLCSAGGGRDCVVDGDTFWFAGEKYRIADIDTPATHPSDRKSVVEGKRVSVRVDLGGRRLINKKKTINTRNHTIKRPE